MSWGIVAGAAISVVGGAMQADAAGDAADQQAAGAGMSTAEQRRQYDQTRADQAPFRNTGVAANRRLSYLLGLPGEAPVMPATYVRGQTNDPIWEKMLDQYYQNAHLENLPVGVPWNTDARTESIYNTLKSRYATAVGEQQARGSGTDPNDPNYGSLLRKFSQADLEADPVYQSGLKFGLDEGTRGINNRAIANGSYDSGATLKALTRFGNDYASTKGNESYNRYNADQTNVYNRLAGVSGAGQQATNQVQAAGTNMANNVSNNYVQEGDARAAGIVGGANAWAGGLQNAYGAWNNYNQQQMLRDLIKGNGNQGYNTYGADY